MVDNGDFISKLRQIEQIAYTVAANMHDSAVKANLRQIALVARTLLSHLEIGAVTVVQMEPKLLSNEVKKPRA